MNLIDLDILVFLPLPPESRNYRTYNLDDAYDDGFNDAIFDVEHAPVIDAIPVSWILENKNLARQVGAWQYELFLETLLKDWEEEKNAV